MSCSLHITRSQDTAGCSGQIPVETECCSPRGNRCRVRLEQGLYNPRCFIETLRGPDPEIVEVRRRHGHTLTVEAEREADKAVSRRPEFGEVCYDLIPSRTQWMLPRTVGRGAFERRDVKGKRWGGIQEKDPYDHPIVRRPVDGHQVLHTRERLRAGGQREVQTEHPGPLALPGGV